MELVGMLRVLARRRLLVTPGLALATFAALTVLFHVSLAPPSLTARATSSGVATTQLLLAAPHGGSYDLDSRIGDTIPARATLVADLAASDVAKARIAGLAGVDAGALAVFGPASGAPAVPVPIAAEATTAAGLAPEATVIRLDANPTQPIITLHVTAPDMATAARLAAATRVSLVEAIRARSGRRPVVSLLRLGLGTQKMVSSAPKKPVALIALVLVLVLWCSGVIVLDGALRRMRVARAARTAARGRPLPSPFV
jgi:hypothetical protein